MTGVRSPAGAAAQRERQLRRRPGGLVSFLKRRAIGEGLISVGALCALVALLATFDPRVKQEILTRVNAGDPAGQMASAEATVRGLASVVIVAARDQSI